MQKSWFFVFLHMLKKWSFLFYLFSVVLIRAQEARVPVDLRQHNLSEYNASIFNPVLSFNENNQQSVSFWTRWQWQQIDTDPTTLFLNYSRHLNEDSAAGIGFFQHNTGVFLNTGAVLNYAYNYAINDDIKIGVGLNLFGFKQELADTRFRFDPDFPLAQGSSTNDFILRAAPGILFKWKKMQLGVSSENLFDYNFARKERQTSPAERIYLLSGGYDFQLFSGNSILSPLLYYKSIPFQDNQFGLSTLFSAEKYWIQAGYNTFYGVSIGAGGRFFKRVSLGALIEFATDDTLEGKEASFEIVAAYQIGKQKSKAKEEPKKKEELIVKTPDQKEDQEVTKEARENERIAKSEERKLQKKREQKEKEAIREAIKEEKLALKTKEAEAKMQAETVKKEQEAEELALQKRIDAAKKEQLAIEKATAQQKMDSLANVDAERIGRREAAAAAQKRLDSISQVKAEKADLQEQQQQEKAKADLSAERVRRKEAAIAAQRRLDSVNVILAKKEADASPVVKEKVVLEQNEKYEEVKTEDGLAAGFYLIANVFGTKKYYEAFMEDLNKKGLNPKSFLRSLNNYQYVYLERYDTMAEARKARNSKFFGKYSDKTWVFRVVGE